jgi:acetylornithine/N-succinyldiaminopimelate aminotransferase
MIDGLAPTGATCAGLGIEDRLMNTYGRLEAVMVRGEGSRLFDSTGKSYLDFMAGIGVNCLGHAHPLWLKAVVEQAGLVAHVSNYYYNAPALELAQRLVAATGMARVFLANSGAEANEGAIKLARKYSQGKYGKGRSSIVSLRRSFHGRTITTLAATGQDRFHRDFWPFTEGFVYAEPDLDSVLASIDKTTCAVIVEPVQGEGGVYPLGESFMVSLARECADRDILLIADEVQCGVGRTGSFLASAGYGVEPDIVTLAKGLAGGLPIGAFICGEKLADVLGPGDHGTTFGGNPLSARAACVVLDVVLDGRFLAEVARKGAKVAECVESWKLPTVCEVRERGLMIGIDITGSAHKVMEEAFSEGLLVLTAGERTVRLLPPLVITDEELKEGLGILRRTIARCDAEAACG